MEIRGERDGRNYVYGNYFKTEVIALKTMKQKILIDSKTFNIVSSNTGNVNKEKINQLQQSIENIEEILKDLSGRTLFGHVFNWEV